MKRWKRSGEAAARLFTSQLVLASFLVANAVPALHHCPEIGSVARNTQSSLDRPGDCHRTGSEAHQVQPAKPGTTSTNLDKDANEEPVHDHGVCPVCQGYLSIQDLNKADFYALQIQSQKGGLAFASPPISIATDSIVSRARDPPSWRFA
ncbi:MAG: hypothetical protein RH862_10535 [Leptospiraceae bacterium]